jgi:hypothetical protein
MTPITEQLDLPTGYGSPKRTLVWDEVRLLLEQASQYWVASTRPDGRPHVVPRDGIWLDDTWYYGGSPETVNHNNIQHNSAIAMHIGDGVSAVIVEGRAVHTTPTPELAEQLAQQLNRKYAHYGLNLTGDTYLSRGTWTLKAHRVLAWTSLPENATRFRFPVS